METRKNKLMNFRPAVFVSAGLIFGILLSYGKVVQNHTVYSCVFILLIVSFTLYLSYLIYCKNKRLFAIVLLALILFIVGWFLVIIKTENNYVYFGDFNFSGKITEIFSEVVQGDGYAYKVIVNGNIFGYESASAYLEFYSNERVYLGSKVEFFGNFSFVDDIKFTLSTGVDYFASAKGGVSVYDVSGIFEDIKKNLFNLFYETSPKTSGLSYALLTGDTCYVLENSLTKYRETGIAHLFAVSGLHIGLAYVMLSGIVKLLKINDKSSFTIISLTLLLYVWFCGFTSSSLRAFIIILVRGFAKLIGEKPDGTTSVSISATIILLIKPLELFSAGFLLSYSVYLALILLTPKCTKILSYILPLSLSKVLSPLLVAELASFPLLLDFFSYAPLFAFIFNLFIIPYVSFLYPFIFLSSFLLLIFNGAFIFSIIPTLSFGFLEFILSKANTSIFLVKGFNFHIATVFYFLLLYTFSGRINLTKKQLYILRIILLLLTILLLVIINIGVLY